ncbi:hypothetical protein [Yinghuangia seranimata]|uniref:hypothetical protein n=1 Tax=Yinghuangia seranimata TaxID=408067 RepID=UPI00248C2045|nr:hypothetical protein [Yinghuangia seranimata]MDI2124897.1 hypothetical protein [Yinghuangia seranimata]
MSTTARPGTRRPARRATGSLTAAALLAAGLGTALLPTAAHAGTVTPSVHCVLPAGQGEATGPQSMNVVLTPASAAPGSSVHAVVTLGTGPANSTVSLSQVPTTPSLDLAMSGGATGSVTVTGPTVNLDTVAGQPVQIPVYEGDFMVPANASGLVSFAPTRTVTKTVVFGSTYTTPCDVVSGGGAIGTVDVQGPGSGSPTLSSPTGTVRPGYTLPFAGLGFPAGAAATPSLCPADGSACLPAAFGASNLSVSASGELSGTATLATTGVPDGSYLVKASAGGKEASSPLTVEAFVQSGDRVATATPSSGPLGTVVTVTGSNWTANTTVNIVQTDAGGLAGPGTVSATTSPDGTFTVQYPVTDAATTQIRVREGISSTKRVFLPFTVTVDPPSVVAAPAVTHRGGVVAVSGAHYPAGAAATAVLCDASGGSCGAAALSGTALSVAADGTLSGTVTVAGNAAFGSYLLKVTAGGAAATTPLTIQQRWITLTPDAGPVGTWTTITGTDYADWAWIKLVGVDATGKATSDYSYAAADGAGNWLTWMEVKDPRTTAIVASETFHPSKSARAPFTVTP